MDFKGIYFEKEIPHGKEETSIVLNGQYIQVHGENHEEKWQTFQVNIEVGGANNHLIFFSHQSIPGKSFYIFKDKEVIQYLLSLNISQWNETIQGHHKSKNKSNLLIGSVGLSVVLFLYLIFASRGFLARKVVESIPYSLEQKIGDTIVGNALPPGKIYQDQELLDSLDELLKPLSETLPTEYKTIRVYISNDETLNAFALPGGHIVFNVGSLRKARDGTEILGVAAHEMAHVTQRHVLRNLIQGLGMFTLVQLIIGDVTGLLAVLADQGSFLLMRGFSRSMEEEADEVGFQSLLDANIDPRGMAGFFELIMNSMKLKGPAGKVLKEIDSKLNFLSTHPETESRIEAIKAKYDELPEERKSGLIKDFKAFDKIQERLKSIQEKENALIDKMRKRRRSK